MTDERHPPVFEMQPEAGSVAEASAMCPACGEAKAAGDELCPACCEELDYVELASDEQPPPERFQFSLKTLMLVMTGAALVSPFLATLNRTLELALISLLIIMGCGLLVLPVLGTIDMAQRGEQRKIGEIRKLAANVIVFCLGVLQLCQAAMLIAH